jgi:predicted nucleotidyltransferase
MVQIHDIQQFADGIAYHFHPQRIVLFGSYAWGAPGPDSDVDLLVVMPFEGKNWRMAAQIRQSIRPTFPLDLLVRTPEQIRQRLSFHDGFFQEITTKGRVLYEAGNS